MKNGQTGDVVMVMFSVRKLVIMRQIVIGRVMTMTSVMLTD